MRQLHENRSPLNTWGAANQSAAHNAALSALNYFAIPGLIKEPVMPTPYHREIGKMLQPQFKPEFIKQTVLDVLYINNQALMYHCRKADMVDNRCILVWLCYKYAFETGMGKISRLIDRDRTTCIHLVERANNCIETGVQGFIEKLQRVETKLVYQ